jgi:paraquat-inducible protein B
MITVEDLWDLSVTQLDGIFKTLNAQIKQEKEESLLTTKSASEAELDNKNDIIRYVVATKQAEAEKVRKAKETKAETQKILEIIGRKQDAALENMSIEELYARINAMNQ